jgi:hypothetical protein
MAKKWIVLLVMLSFVAAMGLSTMARADEIVKAKVDSVNKDAKKIVLDGKEYTLSDDAAQSPVDAGDQVEATVEGDVVKEIKK